MAGRIIVTGAGVTNLPAPNAGRQDATPLELFQRNFKVDFKTLSDDGRDLQFDMIGVDASFANAVRRILIAEVPTMAIEDVYIAKNTSIIQDEVLAHRLGLIPIKVDPRLFNYRPTGKADPTDKDTLEFKLKIKCEKNPQAAADETNPDHRYKNSKVYARQIEWNALGSQETLVGGPMGCVVADPDILVAKLRPGQEIDVTLHCAKGIGRTHAKWSPVGTASYRLLPKITLLETIKGDAAVRLRDCFVKGVIGINDQGVAFVDDPRKCTMSREVFRHEEFTGKVSVERAPDHFIFDVESTGILPPAVLVTEALRILGQKCAAAQLGLQRAIAGGDGGGGAMATGEDGAGAGASDAEDESTEKPVKKGKRKKASAAAATAAAAE